MLSSFLDCLNAAGQRSFRPRASGCHSLAAMVAGAALVLSAPAADAAWVVEPSAELESRYDDNVRLRPTDEEDGIQTSVNLQARLRNVTEISQVSALAGASLTRYSGTDTFSDKTRETGFLRVDAGREFERGAVGIRGEYQRRDLLRNIDLIDSPAGAEPVETDSGDAADLEPGVEDELLTGGDVDDGSVEQLVRRSKFSVAPKASFVLSEIMSLELSYDYTDVSYGGFEQGTANVQDYESDGFTTRLERQLSPLSSAWVQARYSRFDPEFNMESESWDGTVGWNRQLTERTRLTLSAGARRTENDVDVEKGVLFNGRLDRSTERGTLYAVVQRSLMPSGFGRVVESDRVTLGLSERISDRLEWRLVANAFRTEDSVEVSNRNQDYFRISPEIRWRLTDSISAGANYAYTWVDRQINSTSASRHSVGVSLIYSPPRRL